MPYPLLFGPPTLNAPMVHEYVVPVTIGSTATAATWTGYGIDIIRPTSTTMKITFPTTYANLLTFEVGRFPATVTSQVGWVVSTNNIAVDGTITLTSTAAGSATAPASTDVFYLTFRMTSDKLQDAFVGSVT